MSRIAKITTVVLVCGITLSAAAYFLRDTAVAGVVMQKVNGYRLNSGLVGHWTFDGTDLNFQTNKALDRSGQGNNGEMVSMSTSTSRVAGKVGQALQFDGVDDEVLPSLNLNGISTVTVSFWLRVDTWINTDAFTVDYDGGSEGFFIAPSEPAATCNAGEAHVIIHTGVGPNEKCYTHPSAREWHHWVAVFDVTQSAANEVTLYIDGVTQTSWFSPGNNNTVALPSGTLHLMSGLAGTLDDVRIYNRALSASEVKLLYTSTAGSKMNTSKNVIPGSTLQTGLVGLWSFDGPDITDKVYDRSGQGKHGYFYGGATNTAKTSGKVGQGLNFTATPLEQVQVGAFPSVGDRKTLCTWIFPRGLGTILSREQVSGWFFEYSNADSGIESLYFYQRYAPNQGYWRGPSGAITLNKWQHVCVTHDGSLDSTYPIFYVNGETVTMSEINNSIGTRQDEGTGILYVAAYDAADTSFNGKIDDVRIYNRILSPSEVKDLYTATAGAKVNTSQNVVTGSSLQSGLVGLWSFNGPDITDKVYDRSGQGNNGYFIGNATNSAKTSGKIGQGLRFDGVDDWVNTKDINATDGASYLSVSLWIKQDFLAVDRGVVSKWSAGSNHWVLYTVSSPGPDVMAFNSGNGGVARTTSGAHEAGVWEHWTIVFDGTQSGDANRLKMYKNGTLQSLSFTDTILATLGSSANTVKIGASGDVASPCCFWNGKIDETRVYNRALTAAEVKLLYNLGH